MFLERFHENMGNYGRVCRRSLLKCRHKIVTYIDFSVFEPADVVLFFSFNLLNGIVSESYDDSERRFDDVLSERLNKKEIRIALLRLD